MSRLALIAAVSGLALLGGASTAQSRVGAFFGGVQVAINGWGSVQPGRGFDDHSPLVCTKGSCRASATARASHVTLVAKPYQGWKFAGWSGACKRKVRTTCTIDLSVFHANGFGDHIGHIKARFAAVAPGLTRSHPAPIGRSRDLEGVWKLRVNSATPNVQLSPTAPAGTEYFAANVTVTQVEPGSTDLSGFPELLDARGSHNVYGRGAFGCPGGGPAPYLASTVPYGQLNSGQSATGNVCWQIAAADEASLELDIRVGGGSLPALTTWFALH